MNIEEIATELEALNLEGDEARVYLRLLETGSTKVSALSDDFEMSRSTLYRVLDGLTEKGFVSKSLDRPTVYTAEDPETVFEIGSQDLRRQLEHLDRVQDRVIGSLRKLSEGNGSKPDSYHWKRLEGASRIYEVIHQCAQNAEETVDGMSNHKLCTETWMPAVEQAWQVLSEQGNNGLDVRLLLGFPELESEIPEHVSTSSMEIRAFDPDDVVHFLVFDETELVLVVRPQSPGKTEHEKVVAVWTDAPGIVATHRTLFRSLWSAGTPV